MPEKPEKFSADNIVQIFIVLKQFTQKGDDIFSQYMIYNILEYKKAMYFAENS